MENIVWIIITFIILMIAFYIWHRKEGIKWEKERERYEIMLRSNTKRMIKAYKKEESDVPEEIINIFKAMNEAASISGIEIITVRDRETGKEYTIMGRD